MRMVEEFDRRNQRMLDRMLELLRAGVDEEEEVSKDDCCDEHHPPADAFQVLDKSPPTEWPATSAVVSADCGSLLLANSSEKGLGSVTEQGWPSQELQLSGCEGSYVGMVIRQHCEAWQVMTPHAHRMEGGWLVIVYTAASGRP